MRMKSEEKVLFRPIVCLYEVYKKIPFMSNQQPP